MGLLFTGIFLLGLAYYYVSLSREEKERKTKETKEIDIEQQINTLKIKGGTFSKSVFSGKTRTRDDFINLQNERDELIADYVSLKHQQQISYFGKDDFSKTQDLYGDNMGANALHMHTASDFIKEILLSYANRKTYKHLDDRNFDHLYIYQEVIPALGEQFEHFVGNTGDGWRPAGAMRKQGYTLSSSRWYFSRREIKRDNLEKDWQNTQFHIKQGEEQDHIPYDDLMHYTYPFDACPPRHFMTLLAKEESEISDYYYSLHAYQQRINDNCHMILLCEFYKQKDQGKLQAA